MKKRIISMFLTFVLCLSLMPTMAFATNGEPTDISTTGLTLTPKEMAAGTTVYKAGEGTVTVTLSEDTTTLDIVLSGAEIATSAGKALSVDSFFTTNITAVNLKLIGENRLTGQDGLFFGQGKEQEGTTVTISAENGGTLDLHATGEGIFLQGKASQQSPTDLVIESGSVNIESEGEGVFSYDSDVTICGNASVNIQSKEDGIWLAWTASGVQPTFGVTVKGSASLNLSGASYATLILDDGGSKYGGTLAVEGNAAVSVKNCNYGLVANQVMISGGTVDATENVGEYGVYGYGESLDDEPAISISGGMVNLATKTKAVHAKSGSISITDVANVTAITSEAGATAFNVAPDLTGNCSVLVNSTASAEGATSWDSKTALNSYPYVKITPKSYTVTFDSNGGSDVPQQAVVSGSYAKAPETPTKNGYDFRHWYLTDADTAVDISNYTISDDTTFYAAWAPTEYTITYVDGENSENPTTYTIESKAITLLAPTKSGYTFNGWYNGDTKVETIPSGSTGNLTLTAKWTYNQPSSSGSSKTTSKVTTEPSSNGTISLDKKNAVEGTLVTITPKPNDGYELTSITVTDKSGNKVKVTEKNGKYTFIMPDSAVTVEGVFSEIVTEPAFKDVPADAYFFEAVEWAAEKGITGGIGNGLFGPNQPCTRAQIVTFLWRAAGSPVVNYAMNMTDVAEDAYYAEAVRWALSEGITTGTGDGKFSPDATCTRAQSVTFLFRAIGKLVDSKAEFSDVLTDSYYANAVAWAVENGITNGIGDGLFGSNNSCTRAQIVTFLFRSYAA